MTKKMPPDDPNMLGDIDFEQLKEEDVVYLPTKDRIIVRPVIKKTNLIIPGNKQILDNPIAEVLAVGPGTSTITGEKVPIPLNVGDKVLVAFGAGIVAFPLKIDGKVAFIMSFHDVLSVVVDKPKAEA